MIFKKTWDRLISSGQLMVQALTDRNPNDWIKLGIILLVFAVCMVFGYKVSPKIALLSGLLVGGFIGFILLLRRPEIGIFLLIPITFFVAKEFGTGTSVPLNLTFLFAIAIIGIWIFRIISSRVPNHPPTNSINILSIVFLIATAISFIGGNIRWVINAQDQATLFAQVGGWLLYLVPIGLMLYVQTHINDVRWLKIMVWLFILLGSIYILSLFPPFDVLSRFNIFVIRSLESMYWTWLAALAFGQFLFNRKLYILYRIALGLLTLAIVVAGLSASRREWTSGWLPPILAIVTILWLRSWRIGLVTTVIAISTLAISKSSLITSALVSTNQYSITSRAATYPIMFELIKKNPIIGLGFANYSHYTYLYPILGWHVSFNSHNNYMDILAQTGVIGLALFLGLMVAIGLRGWKLRQRDVDGFSSGYINACLGGLVGMLAAGMLGDWFLPYLYNIGIAGFRSSIFAWIFLGGLLALGRIVDLQEKENPATGITNLAK